MRGHSNPERRTPKRSRVKSVMMTTKKISFVSAHLHQI
ncbi:hypothetical protein SynA1544_03118 [Synechococcus sp. A15-44]|nr:hypothetical protein SynA1544_03118 [Synechococcus sp. A15-44]